MWKCNHTLELLLGTLRVSSTSTIRYGLCNKVSYFPESLFLKAKTDLKTSSILEMSRFPMPLCQIMANPWLYHIGYVAYTMLHTVCMSDNEYISCITEVHVCRSRNSFCCIPFKSVHHGCIPAWRYQKFGRRLVNVYQLTGIRLVYVHQKFGRRLTGIRLVYVVDEFAKSKYRWQWPWMEIPL